MMRRLSLLLALSLMFCGTSLAESSERITYDDIVDTARTAESNTDNADILFDDFCNSYKSLCESWDSSWDAEDVSLSSESSDKISINIDGVTITCGTEAPHQISQVSVLAGSTSTDYSKTVKTAALIAVLEYDIPETISERKALLSTVLDDLQDSLYWLSLISSSPKDGDEIQARLSNGVVYYWLYSNGEFYLVAKL